MNTQILYPTEVTAYRIGNEPKVTITAQGREDGYCKIQIQASAAQIYPPIYMVTGEPCGAIGDFPYTVKKTINYGTDLDYIQFQTAHGTKRIPIYDVMSSKKDLPEALTNLNDNQVTGFAYNSSDINVAISDAISKLRKKHPKGGINAVLKDSGFVAVGSPIGIAYYYAVMEQKS